MSDLLDKIIFKDQLIQTKEQHLGNTRIFDTLFFLTEIS